MNKKTSSHCLKRLPYIDYPLITISYTNNFTNIMSSSRQAADPTAGRKRKRRHTDATESHTTIDKEELAKITQSRFPSLLEALPHPNTMVFVGQTLDPKGSDISPVPHPPRCDASSVRIYQEQRMDHVHLRSSVRVRGSNQLVWPQSLPSTSANRSITSGWNVRLPGWKHLFSIIL